MQRVWLTLAGVGYLMTGIPMLMESVRSGNILFWTKPRLTIEGLFGNLTTTAVTRDLAQKSFHPSDLTAVAHAD